MELEIKNNVKAVEKLCKERNLKVKSKVICSVYENEDGQTCAINVNVDNASNLDLFIVALRLLEISNQQFMGSVDTGISGVVTKMDELLTQTVKKLNEKDKK